MAFIDMKEYRKACRKARELVDRITLLEAIEQVYELWFRDRDRGTKVVFHSYFGLALLDLGIEDIFEAEQYRKALAAYFQPRALRKLAHMRKYARPEPRNKVEDASAKEVRVWVSHGISIVFRATRPKGKLAWRHITEAYVVRRWPTARIDERRAHHARKQALQVMNEKRAVETV